MIWRDVTSRRVEHPWGIRGILVGCSRLRAELFYSSFPLMKRAYLTLFCLDRSSPHTTTWAHVPSNCWPISSCRVYITLSKMDRRILPALVLLGALSLASSRESKWHNIFLYFMGFYVLNAYFFACVVPSPPRIVKQPPTDEVLFQVGDDQNDKPFFIECEAAGDPAPQ